VHHRAAGKVKQTGAAKEAAAPDPMCDRNVRKASHSAENSMKAENRIRSATARATNDRDDGKMSFGRASTGLQGLILPAR
jgi:hypothetical protein